VQLIVHVIADGASTILVTMTAFVVALGAWGRPAHDRARANDHAAAASVSAARAWAEVDASLARLNAGIAALDAKIAAVLSEDHGCPSARDREAARAKLEEVKRQQAEARRRLAELRRQMREDATICRLPRRGTRRVVIDTACLENPLARGCM
jgi:hypothetical protein